VVANSRNSNNIYIGNNLYNNTVYENTRLPIVSGLIEDCDAMVNIWDYIYTDVLKVWPEEHAVLIAEPVNDNKVREKCTEIFFERYVIPCYYVAISSVTTLYASGRTTGLVFDIGHDKISAVAINEGYALPNTLITIKDYSGHAVIKHLYKLISANHTLPSYDPAEKIGYDLRNILTKCFVAPKANFTTDKTIQFKLPDGKFIQLQNELWQACESLFSPTLISSIDVLIKSVEDSGMFWKNVVLTGGCSLLEGYLERFNNELLAVKKSGQFTLIAPPERKYSAWIGASILGSLSTFQKMWVSKFEYDDSGPGIVHRKC